MSAAAADPFGIIPETQARLVIAMLRPRNDVGARAARVSRTWRALCDDDLLWRGFLDLRGLPHTGPAPELKAQAHASSAALNTEHLDGHVIGPVPAGLRCQVFKLVRFTLFPGSQVINSCGFPIFPGSQVIKSCDLPLFPGSQVSNPSRYPYLFICFQVPESNFGVCSASPYRSSSFSVQCIVMHRVLCIFS